LKIIQYDYIVIVCLFACNPSRILNLISFCIIYVFLSYVFSPLFSIHRFRILEGSGAGNEFWFFNTHLPHNLGAAADLNTHARIGQMLLDKRIELGAGSSPTIVVGDCNPFASSGASNGTFESNLAQGRIKKIYTGTGIYG
jgi:hypothetical protein